MLHPNFFARVVAQLYIGSLLIARLVTIRLLNALRRLNASHSIASLPFTPRWIGGRTARALQTMSPTAAFATPALRWMGWTTAGALPTVSQTAAFATLALTAAATAGTAVAATELPTSIPSVPIQVAAATGKPARSGASIYSVSCASCHSYGMRGAPKLTDKAAWAPRLAQPPGTLTAHVIKGLGWMPPRGTCSTCSDEEIQAAVDYMVSRLPAR